MVSYKPINHVELLVLLELTLYKLKGTVDNENIIVNDFQWFNQKEKTCFLEIQGKLFILKMKHVG
mgnify:CR=1 FL=1